MNEMMSFIGTIDDALESVPTYVLYMMADQDRPIGYVFRATVSNGFVLVW
jgi:hypothetical protein